MARIDLDCERKADGYVGLPDVQLNFPLSEYNDDEVTAMQGCTQEDAIQKLRRAGKAVELPASPGPGATVAVKLGAAGVVPGVEAAPAGQPPIKKSKVAPEVNTEEEEIAARGAAGAAGGGPVAAPSPQRAAPAGASHDGDASDGDSADDNVPVASLWDVHKDFNRCSRDSGGTVGTGGYWRCPRQARPGEFGTGNSYSICEECHQKRKKKEATAGDGGDGGGGGGGVGGGDNNNNSYSICDDHWEADRKRKAEAAASAAAETISTFETEAERLRSDKAAAVSAVEEQISNLDADAARLRSEGEAASSDASTSRAHISSLEAEISSLKAEVARLQSELGEAETLTPGHTYVAMSGNHLECGICYQEFDDADATGAAVRHMFWPCQHARQCGECASQVWKTPVKQRRCPWCKSKIDSRPRPLKPYI
jgi:cell division protein FtsB